MFYAVCARPASNTITKSYLSGGHNSYLIVEVFDELNAAIGQKVEVI